MLETLEGHYSRGFGDNQKPDTEIDLLPDAGKEADAFLNQHEESLHRLDRISELISGFETPYGLELLSSVHWVAAHEEPAASDERTAARAVENWNQRKRSMFQPQHVQVAWNRLKESGWL